MRSRRVAPKTASRQFRDFREPEARFVCVRRMSGGVGDVRALYAAAYPRLVGVLALASGGLAEAEEVVQEAFVRLLPRWETVGRYDDPEAWVRKVAFRLLANRQRRERVARRVLPALVRTRTDSSPTGDRVDLSRALAALPMGQRQAVVLHHLLDLPVEQVAAEMGVPVGTVKSRLARARVALTPLLGLEVADV